jgi:hypothetical protein
VADGRREVDIRGRDTDGDDSEGQKFTVSSIDTLNSTIVSCKRNPCLIFKLFAKMKSSCD